MGKWIELNIYKIKNKTKKTKENTLWNMENLEDSLYLQ